MTLDVIALCMFVGCCGVVGAYGLVRLVEALGWMPYDEDGNPI